MTAKILERDNGEIYYNEEYLREQIDRAFEKGFLKGIRVEFHSMSPQNDEQVLKCISNFYQHIGKELKK